VARVEAVRDAIGPAGAIRVDANGAWDVAQARRALRELGAFGLEYAEQPCATLADMAELRRPVDVPLAADESIRRAEDPLAERAGMLPVARPAVDAGRLAAFEADPTPWRARALAAARYLDPA